MKKAALMLLLIGCAMGLTSRAVAQSDTIAVTVSLESVVSVSVSPDWNIGAVSLSSSTGPTTFTATNDGTVDIDLDINGADPAGGWTIGSPAAEDIFEVAVASPAITLTTSGQEFATSVAPAGSASVTLTYNAPTGDTFGGGVNQGFDITVTASASP